METPYDVIVSERRRDLDALREELAEMRLLHAEHIVNLYHWVIGLIAAVTVLAGVLIVQAFA